MAAVKKVDVWSAEVPDQPGAVSARLAGLAQAGVNLDFLIARRQPDKPGTGVVFISGVKGAKGKKAAQAAGFATSETLAALRVDAANKPGVCRGVLSKIAAAGINVRGVSAAAIGTKCAVFVAFDSAADAAQAAKVIRKGT